MSPSISRTGKPRPRGRPPTGAESIHLRLLPGRIAAVDRWITHQSDAPSRPEAIRRLVELGLSAHAINQIADRAVERSEAMQRKASPAPKRKGAK